MPELLKWTNRDTIQEVRRDTGLELSWSGGGAEDQVIIQGVTEAVVGNNPISPDLDAATFICAAPPGVTSFTVPAAILRSIPATTSFRTQSTGVLMVAAFSGESSSCFKASLPDGGEIGLGTFGYLFITMAILPCR